MLPILSLFSVIIAKGQAPQTFNYQGIARDVKGNPLSNQTLALCSNFQYCLHQMQQCPSMKKHIW